MTTLLMSVKHVIINFRHARGSAGQMVLLLCAHTGRARLNSMEDIMG